MGQNFRPRFAFHTFVLAWGLMFLLRCTIPPVVHSQTKPGPPSAPPPTVSVIEVSPKALPLYTEYTGTTDALETVEIRARVDGYIEQKLFDGGQLVKAGERLYLLDQRTYNRRVAEGESHRGEGRGGPAVRQRRGGGVPRRVAAGAEPRGAGQGRPGCGALSAPGQAAGGPADQDLDTAMAQRQVLTGRSERPQGRIDANQTPTAHADRAGSGRTGIRPGQRNAWQN